MAELTVEQRDTLLQQNSANIKRQADAAEAFLVQFNTQAAALLSAKGEAWMALYRYHLDARKTALSTATTDTTLLDIVRDAVLMTNAALEAFAAVEQL